MNTEIQLLPASVHTDEKMHDDKSAADNCSIDVLSHTSLSEPLQYQRCENGKTTQPMTPTTHQVEATSDTLFYSYRKRGLRKNSIQNLSRRNRSKLSTSRLSKITPSFPYSKTDLISTIDTMERNENACTKPNDNSRVSPTSIVDFNHSECSNNPSDTDGKNDHHISSSSSFDYVMELKQLQHPLTEILSEPMVVDTLLTEQVRLVRTCTPHDTLTLSSPIEDNENVEIASIAEDMYNVRCTDTIGHDNKKTVVGFSQFAAIPDARPLRRFRSISSQRNSNKSKPLVDGKDMILYGDTNEERKEVFPMITCIRSSSSMSMAEKVVATTLKKHRSWPILSRTPQSKKSLNVRFNETMEVRYFYRSDDEIAIMKQCAIERRAQQELRRRLRRRFRKGESSLLSSTRRPITKNSFLSFFGDSWTTAQQKTYSSDEDLSYDLPDGSLVNCGVHFECYDRDDDGDNENKNEQVALNDATSNISKNRKSWLERFVSLGPPASKLCSEDHIKRSNTAESQSAPTTGTSANFFNHIADGLSAIKFDDIFDYGLTTSNENSSDVTMLDPLNGATIVSPKTEEENLGKSSDHTEPLWIVTALTCGNNNTTLSA